jgi:hypothetical protein
MNYKKLPDSVDFTRYKAEIEIRFVNGNECCEWCNLSFKNRKGHIECGITGEEMIAPGETIGWKCPLRTEVNDENS